MWSELTKAIATCDIPADWIGIRAVKETSSQRYVRDCIPQTNGKSTTMGAMLEVLVNGCLGYAATNSLELESLHNAARLAYQQALSAREWSIYSFGESERPKVIGEYNSPFLEPLEKLSPGEINDLLVRMCQTLKVNDQIVQLQPASAPLSEKLGLSAATAQKSIKSLSPWALIMERSPKKEQLFSNAPTTAGKPILTKVDGKF
jgi:predicted Zn-dependent protease